jgi:hypothetical protein
MRNEEEAEDLSWGSVVELKQVSAELAGTGFVARATLRIGGAKWSTGSETRREAATAAWLEYGLTLLQPTTVIVTPGPVTTRPRRPRGSSTHGRTGNCAGSLGGAL